MTESLELAHLRRYLTSTGVPHRVTSTTGGQHVAGSFHYRRGTGGEGLALDAAGLLPGRHMSALNAIYGAFLPVRHQLAELLGPGDPGHDDHVHVAVPLGVFLQPKEQPMPDDPNAPNLVDVKFFVVLTDSQGIATGYYMVSSIGEVHGHGPGARFYGRSEVVTS